MLSAFITNDAVCVLARAAGGPTDPAAQLPRLPSLLALATGANTGSVATLVGNPQNMLCASLGKLDFAPFLLHMLPVALVGLAMNHALLLVIFRLGMRMSGYDLTPHAVPAPVEHGCGAMAASRAAGRSGKLRPSRAMPGAAWETRPLVAHLVTIPRETLRLPDRD